MKLVERADDYWKFYKWRELCDKFEDVVFKPLEVDSNAIEEYLYDLFVRHDKVSRKQYDRLKDDMRAVGYAMLDNEKPFDVDTVGWCINGLLAEQLLSDEKSKSLREFLHNDMVLGEIADVLNMRYSDISNWEWFADQNGIVVMPRPELNGKYRIWMDEDILQGIFIHYIGIKWCIGRRRRV